MTTYRATDARDAEIARLSARLEEASGGGLGTSSTSSSTGSGGGERAQGARAANARIIAQMHSQVDFLSRELAGREAEVARLQAREAAGGRAACQALQVRLCGGVLLFFVGGGWR